MRKEHLIGLVLGVLILMVAGGMYLMSLEDPQVEPIAETVKPVKGTSQQAGDVLPEGSIYVEEVEEEVEGGNVTRIIVEDSSSDSSEISSLLSEKVIVDDQVVDKANIKKK